MLFSITSLLLLLATAAHGQSYQDAEVAESSASASSTPTELDINEPTLWQMAAFAARAMSTKSRRFKLATLTSAEQAEASLTRLKVTLQRVNQAMAATPFDKTDILFCTVDVRSKEASTTAGGPQQWAVENFGCTAPAIVRRRRPTKKVTTPALAVQTEELNSLYEQPQSQPQTSSSLDTSTYKYLAPVDNSIDTSVGGNGLEDLPKRQVFKRQTFVSRPSAYFPQYVQYSPQPQTVRYLPMPAYQRPMNYYYQAYY